MTTKFTLHLEGDEAVRVSAQEMSVKGDVRVYALSTAGGEQYVLKFTTAFDVCLHRSIIADERTRTYVVPLEDTFAGRRVLSVSGRAAWSRGPYKLMRRLALGQLRGYDTQQRAAAVDALKTIHGLPVPGDWCRAGNTLNDGQREYYFDFDAEEGQLAPTGDAEAEVEVLGPPAARSAFLHVQQLRRCRP